MARQFAPDEPPATVSALGGRAAAPSASLVTVSREDFGMAYDLYAGKDLPVYRYTLRNGRGMSVCILTYGGIVQSITVPSRTGAPTNVVLGFTTLSEYVAHASPPVTAGGGPYFGETIGRFGNRIANGSFTLDGRTYTLPVNNNGTTLHGGLVGFGNHVWESVAHCVTGLARVTLRLISPAGDNGANVGGGATGFPGALTVCVTFTLSDACQLQIDYTATVADKATVLNLTNHSYFNLGGENSGPVYSQHVQINASHYTPTNAAQIPTGAIVPVLGTPFDFTAPHPIGARITEASEQLLIAHGYDHNWVLNKTGPARCGLPLAARAWDDSTGIDLTVWTDQPGLQFYSGNFLTGTLVGCGGRPYLQGWGYTFETQHFPDSPNQPGFPSTVLRPGQVFNSSTIFEFGTC
jgi:aldose 1-epimerase